MATKFTVYRNNIATTDQISATRNAVKEYIRSAVYSTHMGQLIKTVDGFKYDTTIGVYLEFKYVESEYEKLRRLHKQRVHKATKVMPHICPIIKGA